jgi:hypothetical protein
VTPEQSTSAQSAPSKPTDDSLFNTISALDAKFFDAYNKCELEKFGSFLAEDLEFYHDQGGLFRSRQTVVDSVKNNICGKIERELVPGTLEVYPLRGFGAVEIGVHRFRRTGSKDTVSEAKFIQIWENKNGNWQVTRVISFDHQNPAK